MVCDIENILDGMFLSSLNPYSIGIWSATFAKKAFAKYLQNGLNPYSIGIWSATAYFYGNREDLEKVLILILLEYGLRLGVKNFTNVDFGS